ncbi:LexA family protein [Dongia deserti]|uniref:LexA family protein n=1 Tax=Dongia deserti TaxID=2268030 RepID=UPI000E64EF22|nr:LexA family transcriptional regulator [Dongia deserti]
MLTRKQRELLKFIQERLGETGISPSFDEMKEALGLKSKSGVHRLITGLEERGFIKRLPHRARALDVVRLPEDQTVKAVQVASRTAVGEERRAALNVIRGDFTPSLPGAVVAAQPSSALQLPLYGKIAAGTPIEALRDNSNSVDVPATMLGRGEHYALTVEGDSMVDAGIQEGDTVVIERCETAENGTIVVALIDNSEVTLKRLRRKGDSIALEPANPAHKTRIFGPDRVRIQGRLVGLMRRY